MDIEYTVHVWKEGNHYIAHAMPLDVISSGPSPEAAKAALKEAVQLFFDTIRDMGTLEDILHECGYEMGRDKWISPPWIAVEKESMAIGA
jgi:predicted RNase H-like HicB family nuclease